ncbi:MAG: serine protease [Paenibacillaceae bacterium]|nr:serine protease [Paenibacillaceae bacterium]
MALVQDWLAEAGWSLLRMLANPFYYVGIVFVVLQYRREVALERKLLHTRLHSIIGESWRTVLWGWAAGIAASIAMAFVGAAVSFEALLWLWAIMFVLVWLRIRFLCLAYAVGIIGVLQAAAELLPQAALNSASVLQDAANSLAAIELPPLLALVGALHLAEALLVRLQGHRMATPLFFEGKRGRAVGGYNLLGFWPVPLFLLVPLEGSGLTLPWQPLLMDGGATLGWGLVAFPVVIGFADRTQSLLPRAKMRLVALRLSIYAPVVLLLAYAAYYWSLPLLSLAASVAVIALHEALIAYGSREEERRSPLYVHDESGLKVLAVLPGSAAEAMGIAVGETISKVNGERVRSKEEMHLAMRLNPAFCKLEVVNLAGHVKFVGSAVFADKHHQLGILLCPDEQAPYYVPEKQQAVPLPALLARRWFGVRRGGRGETHTHTEEA